MNSPFVIERARALLQRAEVAREVGPPTRIRQMYRAVFQRPPTSKQINAALDFLNAAAREPIFKPLPVPIPNWRYGFGHYDESSQRITNFMALPHFTGDAWQGGVNWPDEKLGWVRLTADGGHAGNDLLHAAIRRWIAPTNMVISASGTIQHDHEEGDGVRARIVSNRSGSLGTWVVHKNQAETKIEAIEVAKGDTLDFVVDFNANLNNDDFVWNVTIHQSSQPSVLAAVTVPREWNSKKSFAGPPVDPPESLTPWEQYAQVLLLSNEFLFVD